MRVCARAVGKIAVATLCGVGVLMGSMQAQDALHGSPAPAAAQQSSPKALPKFDAATIKLPDPNKGGKLGFYSFPGGRVSLGFATVKMLLNYAYNVQDFQISGGPDWAGTERYNIDAVPPEDSPTRTASVPPIVATPTQEQRQMIQSLLADRFALKAHHEVRQGPVYLLTRGNGKLSLKEPEHKDADSRGNLDPRGWAFGQNASMTFFADRLSRDLKLPVIDQTGLSGKYDFQLEADDPENKDIEVGIQDIVQRLGLKLKKGTGPVDTLVIDHIERPTEN